MNWVYRIIEKNTGNFYIGSSKNIDRREKEHLNDLRKNKHHCYPLQALYNHFGESCIEIERLCYLDELSEAREMEDLILKSFLTLNISMDANTVVTFADEKRRKDISEQHKGNTYNINRKTSQETSNKMSESRKGRKASKETKHKCSESKSIKIKQLTIEGVYIQTFDSVKKAANYIGRLPQNISKCLVGEQQTAYKFKWEYVDNPNDYVIINKITGQIFKTNNECADFYKENRNNMSAYLKGLRVNNKYNFLIRTKTKIENGLQIN